MRVVLGHTTSSRAYLTPIVPPQAGKHQRWWIFRGLTRISDSSTANNAFWRVRSYSSWPSKQTVGEAGNALWGLLQSQGSMEEFLWHTKDFPGESFIIHPLLNAHWYGDLVKLVPCGRCSFHRGGSSPMSAQASDWPVALLFPWYLTVRLHLLTCLLLAVNRYGQSLSPFTDEKTEARECWMTLAQSLMI